MNNQTQRTLAFALVGSLALAGCASSSGTADTSLSQPSLSASDAENYAAQRALAFQALSRLNTRFQDSDPNSQAAQDAMITLANGYQTITVCDYYKGRTGMSAYVFRCARTEFPATARRAEASLAGGPS